MSNAAFRTFASGEQSPAMYARTDAVRFQQGLRTLRNGVVMRTGGIESRPGTKYCGTTKDNGEARLVGVVFDSDQNYVLELGVGYVRFWREGSLITGTVSGAWASGGAAYAAGVIVSHLGTNYVCIAAGGNTVNDEPTVGANWETYWYALTGTTYELPMPYTTFSEVREVQYALEYGVVRFVHRNHPRTSLTRVAEAQWALTTITASISTLAAPTNVANGAGAPGTQTEWKVTAVDVGTGRESVASTATGVTLDLAAIASSPVEISWTAATGATAYRVYRKDEDTSGLYGFLAEVNSSPYTDAASAFITADTTRQPPSAAQDFSDPTEYPGVIGAYQQRLLLSGSSGSPDVVKASRTASPDDFGWTQPLVDSDAIEWRQVGRRLNRIRHFSEVAQRLIQFSDVGESVIQGSPDGVLRPGEVNPRQFSENGAAAYPQPIVVNDSALYVQARGGWVRDLAPIQNDQLGGSDLTLTAAHLVDGYTIEDWCYQQTPHSVVWAVRNDGVLVGLTYVRELGIVGWHRHDTVTSDSRALDGLFRSICTVPEGVEDAVYAVVQRRINGATKRYVERMYPRFSYGGSSTAIPFMDSTIAIAPNATNTITGLGHLEGRAVSVVVDRFGLTDGTVLASPNNTGYATVTVSGGAITVVGLAAASAIHVGLPITTDVQTLDIDAAGTTIKDRGIFIGGVKVWTQDTGRFWSGPRQPATDSASTLEAIIPTDENWGTETTTTGVMGGPVLSTWNNTGRVFIRQVDPVPMTILAISPQGHFGGR